MLPQDVIRAAIEVLSTRGWHQSDRSTDAQTPAQHARNHAGEAIPLYRADKSGESVARINPDAASFSAYGALVAAIQAGGGVLNPGLLWDTLHRLASSKVDMALGGNNHVHPLLAFNDATGTTKEQVIALLEEAAKEIDPDTEVVATPVPVSVGLDGPMVEPPEKIDGIVDDPISPAATHTGALAAPVVIPEAAPVTQVVGQIGYPKPTKPIERDVAPDSRLPTVDWNKP